MDQPRKRSRDEDDFEDDEVRPRKKKKRVKETGMDPTVYWAIRGTVLLVLLGVLGVGAILLKNRMAENEKIRQYNKEVEERNRKLAEEEAAPLRR
jgi:cell division protein FtsB